jgi:hypothetical protein
MPSLIGSAYSKATTNYLKMPAQHTYGIGTVYSNFATRQLRFVKIVATTDGSAAVDFTKDTGLAGGTAFTTEGTGYRASASVFSNAVRAVQIVGEVYFISEPNATGFVIAVAEDTVNDSDANSNLPSGYGDLEDAIKAAFPSAWSGATVTASTYVIAA